jgi:plastocyanin
MRRKWARLIVLLFPVIAMVGIQNTPATAFPTNEKVGIRFFAFDPNQVIAHPGQVLRVRNFDGRKHGIPHSLTARDGSFNTGVFIDGVRRIRAPQQPGNYKFFCITHPFMHGVLRVHSHD